MKLELWPITRPVPYARNPRKITEEAIAKCAASIKEFGFRVPIVVDEDDVILAGHTRLLAAQRLELAEIPVHVAVGLSKAQRRAFRIAENRTHTEASNDFEFLALELAELKEAGFDLALTAFDTHELAPLLAMDAADELLNDEDEPATDKPIKHKIEFTSEQFEIIARGIFKIRDIEQEANITDGRALELLVADWLAGAPIDNGAA